MVKVQGENTNNHKDTVYLVDGSGYIFRAFYAVAPLTTKQGFPTNALYGFTRMLGKLLSAPDTSHMVMVFDAGKKTFRSELYPLYKANRAECPAELIPQMPVFREISAALGLQVIEAPGYEADDIIGTLSKRLTNAGKRVVIVTGDKDLSQLVNDQISIWDTMKDKKFGEEGVIEKFGVKPNKVVEVLALMGDSSDNIPGLSGVGPKTATQLVVAYNDVENIIKNVDTIKNDKSIRSREKLSDTIKSQVDILRLSRALVEIHCEVPFPMLIDGELKEVKDLSDEEVFHGCERKEGDKDSIEPLFNRLEFGSLLKELPIKTTSRKPQTGSWKYLTVFDDEFDNFVKNLLSVKKFAFDLETTSLNPLDAKIVGVSFCWDLDTAYYIPIAHTENIEGRSQVTQERLFQYLKPIFEDKTYQKCGQNIKYDISVLSCLGIDVQGVWFDTMIGAYLLNPDSQSFNMTTLAREYLGRGVIEYEDLVGVEDGFQAVSIQDATNYSAEDSHITWMLYVVLLEKLKEKELLPVFENIEMPLVSVISKMEISGVKVDTHFLEKMSEEFSIELEHIRERLINMVGEEFNLNSPKQLAEILFQKLGISTKGVKKTKTGFSTDQSVLELLSDQHEVPREILRHRSLFKLKSTYIDALPAQVHPITGRIHSKFNQTVTSTGRLSSTDPNLQNIPIQSKEGRKIRESFIAMPGNVILSADYSQIELRILAHMSKDKNLISAFKENIDIHTKTAREIFDIGPLLDVTPEQRRIGKTLNFGIIYGMGAFRLAKELGINFRDAEKYIAQYFAQYPNVKQLFTALEQQAQNQGFVTTVFGRKRFIQKTDFSERDKGFQNRIAVNAPIQGTAADIVKLAMIVIAQRIKEERLNLLLTMQVHDELVFEAKESEVEILSSIVKESMQNVVPFDVPLLVEVGTAKSWGSAH